MTRQFIDMTPSLAKLILNASPQRARQVMPRHVAYLAHRMLHPDPEGDHYDIRIDRDGHLNSGRHELLAIIRVDQPVRVYLEDDCDPSPFVQYPFPDGVGEALNEVMQAHDFDSPDAPYQPEVLRFARAAEVVANYLNRYRNNFRGDQ